VVRVHDVVADLVVDVLGLPSDLQVFELRVGDVGDDVLLVRGGPGAGPS